MNKDIGVVLLAGGKGTRMGSSLPKQFLPLDGEPIVLYSLKIFLSHPAVTQVVVVCDPMYRDYFSAYPVTFAQPGETRQMSLFHGFKEISPLVKWICVHDAARPFISHEMLHILFQEGQEQGAAVVGMPLKWTVKEADKKRHVLRTLNREMLWEIQTPQFLKREILDQGMQFALAHGITVTDDVALAELIGHPVKIIQGSYLNLKITTPEDLLVAECFVSKIKCSP